MGEYNPSGKDDLIVKGWHFKKTVDIGVVVFLLIQTFAAVWVVSTLFSTVEQNEQRIFDVEKDIVALKSHVNRQNGTLERLDERTSSIQRDIQDIKKAISD